jgi:hypothetical protein
MLQLNAGELMKCVVREMFATRLGICAGPPFRWSEAAVQESLFSLDRLFPSSV